MTLTYRVEQSGQVCRNEEYTRIQWQYTVVLVIEESFDTHRRVCCGLQGPMSTSVYRDLGEKRLTHEVEQHCLFLVVSVCFFLPAHHSFCLRERSPGNRIVAKLSKA